MKCVCVCVKEYYSNAKKIFARQNETNTLFACVCVCEKEKERALRQREIDFCHTKMKQNET